MHHKEHSEASYLDEVHYCCWKRPAGLIETSVSCAVTKMLLQFLVVLGITPTSDGQMLAHLTVAPTQSLTQRDGRAQALGGNGVALLDSAQVATQLFPELLRSHV